MLEQLKRKIYLEYILFFNGANKSEKEWNAFAETMHTNFGEAGKEIVQRFYFFNLIDKKNWNLLSKEIIPYLDENFKIIHPNDVNEFAWAVFEHCSDTVILKKSAEWMESIANKSVPQYIDTYANLLYKLGKTDEAIKWQKKAVAIANANPEFQNTLDKMRQKIPTWSTTD
jgi:predicted metal-dependent hydrolase